MIKSNSIVIRFFLLIIIPVIILQSVALYVFYQRHWQRITQTLVDSLVGEIEVIVNSYETSWPKGDFVSKEQNSLIAQKSKLESIAQALDMDIYLTPLRNWEDIQISDNSKEANDNQPDELLQMIKAKLLVKLISPVTIYRTERRIHCVLAVSPIPSFVINISFSEKRIQSPTTHIFVLWVIGSALIMLIISILFLRGQLRSILSLTDVASKLGKGEDLGTFVPCGAYEIRAAGYALIQMKKRIDHYVNTRMEVLAHISHDIRTPLTRIKLILSLAESNENTEALSRNIIEIERLLDSYLQFAKGEGNEEMFVIDIKELIIKVIKRLESDKIILYDKMIEPHSKAKSTILISNLSSVYQKKVRPLAMERALVNILDNAIKFAQKEISITLKITKPRNKYLAIIIEDDGPGIAKPKEAILPFISGVSKEENQGEVNLAVRKDQNKEHRLKNSKPQEQSKPTGYGLGLAIAHSIVTAHGGKLILKNSRKLGGAKVAIHLLVES